MNTEWQSIPWLDDGQNATGTVTEHRRCFHHGTGTDCHGVAFDEVDEWCHEA